MAIAEPKIVSKMGFDFMKMLRIIKFKDLKSKLILCVFSLLKLLLQECQISMKTL